jgi:hypothetical protein
LHGPLVFIAFCLPITPRHWLLVINSLRLRKLVYFPVNAVRVFERAPRAMVREYQLASRASRISEAICPFQTGIPQPDRSSR